MILIQLQDLLERKVPGRPGLPPGSTSRVSAVAFVLAECATVEPPAGPSPAPGPLSRHDMCNALHYYYMCGSTCATTTQVEYIRAVLGPPLPIVDPPGLLRNGRPCKRASECASGLCATGESVLPSDASGPLDDLVPAIAPVCVECLDDSHCAGKAGSNGLPMVGARVYVSAFWSAAQP
jgi:hypothetical protein